uniref:Uncharacterized protein n=1 Tax=Anguilla anguilla TaxID=7936 RepID=A0A0E9T4H8_ANGAN
MKNAPSFLICLDRKTAEGIPDGEEIIAQKVPG